MPPINLPEPEIECPSFPEWQQNADQSSFGPRLDDGKEATPVRILNTPYYHPEMPKINNRLGIVNAQFRMPIAQVSTSAVQIIPNGIYDTIEISVVSQPGGIGDFFPIYVEFIKKQTAQGIFVLSSPIVSASRNPMHLAEAIDTDRNKLIINVPPTNAPFIVWTWDEAFANPVAGTHVRNISVQLISQNR